MICNFGIIKNQDWFTVEQIDQDTFAISEYKHWEETHCYLLCGSREALLIDTGLGVSDIGKIVKQITSLPILTVLTHAHWDHIGAVNDIIDKLPKLPIYIGEHDVPLMENAAANCSAWLAEYPGTVSRDKVNALKDGEELEVLGETVRIIEVPGHTAGGICFYFQDSEILFCGDTLFEGSIGRSDLPTGNEEQLITNIKEKLLVLPEVTKVYPGHGMATTIGEEKHGNYFLQ